MELQDHGIAQQQIVNQQLIRMNQETGIDLVCTNDVHYTYADDAAPHDILVYSDREKGRRRRPYAL